MTVNGFATADDLFGKRQRRYCVAEVEGKRFRLRSLTARELYRFRRSVEDSEERLARAEELLIAHMWVDGAGNLQTTEEQIWAADDIDGSMLQCLAIHCGRWSGWRFDFSAPLIEDQKKTEEASDAADVDGPSDEATVSFSGAHA